MPLFKDDILLRSMQRFPLRDMALQGAYLDWLVPLRMPVLATWDIRSEKSCLRAIYRSHSVCRSEAAQVESENMHVFHTLGWYLLSSQRRSLCSLFSSLSDIE